MEIKKGIIDKKLQRCCEAIRFEAGDIKPTKVSMPGDNKTSTKLCSFSQDRMNCETMKAIFEESLDIKFILKDGLHLYTSEYGQIHFDDAMLIYCDYVFGGATSVSVGDNERIFSSEDVDFVIVSAFCHI